MSGTNEASTNIAQAPRALGQGDGAMRALERRMVAHLKRGKSTDIANAPMRIAAREYTDPVRFAAEKKELFGKAPLVAGLSGDIPNPGDIMIFDAAGPAIVITRTKAGTIKAFLNMCMHRGARLVAGCAHAKLITCPFHGWSYDLEGRLVAVPGEEGFDGVDRSERSLISVPAIEWGGIVFVRASAGDGPIDIDAWLGDFAPELLRLELAGARPVKSSRVDVEANWKFALDTYGEAYHFAALHPKTFAPDTCSNVMLYDHFAPHYRVCFVASTYRDLVGRDECDWPEVPYGGSHLLFPNTIVYGAPMPGGGSMIGMYRMFPGEHPNRSFTIMSTYRAADAPDQTPDSEFAATHDYIETVVRTEDYSVSREGQRNLQFAPEGFELVYGRNEIALQNQHRNIANMIGMPLDP